jgi:1-phosphofructokinase
VERLCREARADGARVALDSSGSAFAAGLAGAPDVVKPNLAELREVTGAPVGTVHEVVAAARSLGGAVLVSAGARGALLVSEAGVWHAWSEVPRPVSTVGAGDALLAGFVAAGGTGPDALREAVAWATAAVQVPGSRVPRVTDLHRHAVELEPAPPPDRWLAAP